MDKVSKLIKETRLSKGITVEEMAEATLLSVYIINDLEAGRFDNFAGDELYVKMYLKKIARYLEIDESIADEYYAMTKEIKLKTLQQEQETKQKQKEEMSETFIDKVQDSIKNIQPTMPSKPKKRVYEDHYVLRYVKYGIVIGIVVAMIVLIGWSITSTKNNDSSFNNNNSANVDVSDDVAKQEKDKAEGKKPAKKEDNKKEETVQEITFVRNGPGDFTMTIPENYDQETFKLKVEFTFTTNAKLLVNGQSFPGFKDGTYARDLASEALSNTLLEGSKCETVELDIPVKDFKDLQFSYTWNYGHRYYINDQQVPLELEDHNTPKSSNGLKTFKLTRAE